jgi:hypothetical protein
MKVFCIYLYLLTLLFSWYSKVPSFIYFSYYYFFISV